MKRGLVKQLAPIIKNAAGYHVKSSGIDSAMLPGIKG
jgi:hypothetical protein